MDMWDLAPSLPFVSVQILASPTLLMLTARSFFFIYLFFSPEVPEHLRLKILFSPQPPFLVPIALCLQASWGAWSSWGLDVVARSL